MGVISLAVKYRPKDWDSVCSQTAIKVILQEQIKTNTFQHAYLFVGASGCGKTTCGRIFLNELNKNQGNIIELDMASNGGIEQVRSIIDDSKKKSLDSEYKTFLLDEVHMTSIAGWNALLKLLEEPPKYTIFVLCTTNPEKIPETILNRVQRYDFTKIPTDIILDRLKYICKEENINADEDALSYIAKMGAGGMRTSIAYLDKCISLSNSITIENVVTALGTVDYDTFFDLTEQLTINQVSGAIEIIEEVYNSGKDLKTFIKEYLKFSVDVCKYVLFNDFNYLNVPKLNKYVNSLSDIDKNDAFKIMELFKDINAIIRYDTDVKYTIESILLSEYKE